MTKYRDRDSVCVPLSRKARERLDEIAREKNDSPTATAKAMLEEALLRKTEWDKIMDSIQQ